MDELKDKKIQDICAQFQMPGEYLNYEHINVGNVNQSYIINYQMKDGSIQQYVLQQINTYAFRRPDQLMINARLITEHMMKKNSPLQIIQFQQTASGDAYVGDLIHAWRMYTFIPAMNYSKAENMDMVYETGRAFGLFQHLLSDFDPHQLYETIPGFHNTPGRLQHMLDAIEEDPVGRVAEVQDEIRAVMSMADEACILHRAFEEGKLPLRVTHNDTKMNNVLFDADTNKAITVIDLDTVMPGVIGYDFGDAVRFMANTEAEDSTNLADVSCDMEIFRGFAEGFLGQLQGVMEEDEINTLCYAPFVLSLELACRFLDDYILGDVYFNTDYEKHNLDRARCQLAMAKDCYKKKEAMHEIILACLQDSVPNS